MKRLAGGDGTIEVRGTEDEGTWQFGESTWVGGGGTGFEDLGVRAGITDLAGLGGVARGDAGDLAEDGAEGPSDDVSRLSGREENGLAGAERKTEPVELEFLRRWVEFRHGIW